MFVYIAVTLCFKVSSTQELLKSVQEELCEQKNMSSDLKKVSQEKESTLDQKVSVSLSSASLIDLR